MSPDQYVRANAIDVIRRAAKALVRDAELHGVVLTIVQRPKIPLAMGNYETVVAVRQKLERE